MAFKKGFCTHCRGEERNRIFAVNKEADVCYCPNCTASMKPKEAINNYINLISYHLKKASKALFESKEYLLAYQTFAHVIDLDETVKVAYFGRLLSLVYLSTLRTSKIGFALLLHRQQAKLYHYQENSKEYFNFLWLLLDALDRYEARMKKRILNRDVFYDVDCVTLYLKRIDEIRKYKAYIAEEAHYFVNSNKEQFQVIIDRAKKTEDTYSGVFQQRFVTGDGNSYLFSEFDSNGNPKINLQANIPVQTVHHFQQASLNPKDGKKSDIKDEIFASNSSMSKFIAISIPLAIILLAAVATGMIASIMIPSPTVKLLIYIISALLLPASLVLVALHFSWKNRLKKNYYNGTNPFIFK